MPPQLFRPLPVGFSPPRLLHGRAPSSGLQNCSLEVRKQHVGIRNSNGAPYSRGARSTPGSAFPGSPKTHRVEIQTPSSRKLRENAFLRQLFFSVNSVKRPEGPGVHVPLIKGPGTLAARGRDPRTPPPRRPLQAHGPSICSHWETDTQRCCSSLSRFGPQTAGPARRLLCVPRSDAPAAPGAPGSLTSVSNPCS